MRIAFCGLGLMGAPMAERLVDAGHDVVVWNRSPEKAERLVERGAQRAATPAEAGSGAEAAVTMLSDPDAVRAVVLGPDGLAAGLGPRSVLVEMSTVGPGLVREVREGLPDHVDMVDAPSGGASPRPWPASSRSWWAGTARPSTGCGRWSRSSARRSTSVRSAPARP